MAATAKKHYPNLTPGSTYTYRDTQTGLSIIATFTEVSSGFFVVVADTGVYDLYKDGVKQSNVSPLVHIDSNSIPKVGGIISYGSGSDGAYTLDGTQAAVSGLFSKESSTHYTLLRDGYFTQLNISAGVTFATAGYRIFANSGVANNGIIDNSGAAGGNATSAVAQTKGLGGSATADATGGYCPGGGPGGAGGNGGDGSAGPVAGSAGGAIAGGYWNQAVGLTGKSGGHGGDNGTVGSLGGAATGTALPATSGSMRNSWNAILARAFSATAVVAPVYNQTNGGSGAGSRGIGTGYGSGGGGGAAGNNGGVVIIVARNLTGSGVVSANGGVGGNGGNGGNATGVGGGGGGGAAGNGGNGGTINIFYGIDSSTWSYSVAGGAAGAKGIKGTVVSGALGTDGEAGVSGVAGIKKAFVI